MILVEQRKVWYNLADVPHVLYALVGVHPLQKVAVLKRHCTAHPAHKTQHCFKTLKLKHMKAWLVAGTPLDSVRQYAVRDGQHILHCACQKQIIMSKSHHYTPLAPYARIPPAGNASSSKQSTPTSTIALYFQPCNADQSDNTAKPFSSPQPLLDFILWKLDSIARLGYAAFALDMFGTGRALWDRSESLAARRPITEDRSLMQARANAALQTLRKSAGVDPDRLAAVGYCFGGMVVLDLARMEPAATPGLKAVASLHGMLVPILPGFGGDAAVEDAKIGPRVVVLHASGDPFVPPEQVPVL